MQINRLTIPLLLLIISTGLGVGRFLARDSEPGGLYIIGPNLVPGDSLLGWKFLYYSPDTGKTFSRIDTFLYSVEPGYDNVYADLRAGTCYEGNLSFVQRFDDYGLACVSIGSTHISSSGSVLGECINYGNSWSTDYGETWIRHLSRSLWTFCTAFHSGCGIDFATNDTIYLTTDYGASYNPISPFEYDGSMIETGAEENEFFIYDNTAKIYYSFDGCTTFVEEHSYEESLLSDSLSLLENTCFVRGWQSMEILCYQYYQYPAYPCERPSPGGIVEIFISKDCGATWDLIARNDVRPTAIAECRMENKTEALHVEQSSTHISVNEPAELYDLRGRIMGQGCEINITNNPAGLYILKSGNRTKKIFIIK